MRLNRHTEKNASINTKEFLLLIYGGMLQHVSVQRDRNMQKILISKNTKKRQGYV